MPRVTRRSIALPSASKSQTTSIRRFANVVKPGRATALSHGLTDSVKDSKQHPNSDNPDVQDAEETSKKRKRDAEDFNEIESVTVQNGPSKKQKIASHRTLITKTPKTPKKNQANLQCLPTPESTPSKANTPCSELGTPSKPLEGADYIYDSPLSTPLSKKLQQSRSSQTQRLPIEVQDIIQLNSSFLKALSLQFAHQGTAQAVDVRVLCPIITKIWGKRKVILDDVRRLLGLYSSHSPLSLLDYGRGKTCIELSEAAPNHWSTGVSFDEDYLKEQFSSQIGYRWQRWKLSSDQDDEEKDTVEDFVKGLPVLKIARCYSLDRAGNPLAEGQRRLEDLKSVVKQAQAEEAEAKSQRKSAEPVGVKSRSQNLLERLKAKENTRAALPPPPSKAQSDRRAALQRMQEIVNILSPPSSGTQRKTQTLSAAVQKVQNSARSSLSREEVELCLRLLAEEVASEFATFVESGGVTAIVIDQASKPTDLGSRIERALGTC